MDLLELKLASALVIVAYMTLLWLVSLAVSDASIVDSAWGPGFVLLALLGVVAGDGYAPRRYLILVLVTVWGLRLGLHIFLRNRGHGEDPRYRAFRKHAGPSWWWKSYLKVFLLQGFVMWLVSFPLRVAGAGATPDHLTLVDGLGVALWLVGFYFEAVGDLQLTRFKSDPANGGRVMNQGLWRFTRHPNYFGDATLWWGIGLLGLLCPWGWLALVGPALMTLTLMKVSGVAMLERTIAERRPGYQEYIASTNAFFPGRPKPSRRPNDQGGPA